MLYVRGEQKLLLAEAKAVKNGTFAISDVFVGVPTGSTYVAIVQPVMSDEKVAYLLHLDIPTDIISNIMRSQLKTARVAYRGFPRITASSCR